MEKNGRLNGNFSAAACATKTAHRPITIFCRMRSYVEPQVFVQHTMSDVASPVRDRTAKVTIAQNVDQAAPGGRVAAP